MEGSAPALVFPRAPWSLYEPCVWPQSLRTMADSLEWCAVPPHVSLGFGMGLPLCTCTPGHGGLGPVSATIPAPHGRAHAHRSWIHAASSKLGVRLSERRAVWGGGGHHRDAQQREMHAALKRGLEDGTSSPQPPASATVPLPLSALHTRSLRWCRRAVRRFAPHANTSYKQQQHIATLGDRQACDFQRDVLRTSRVSDPSAGKLP